MDKVFSNYDLNVKNVFPARGRAWCKWEEDFLLDWLETFGLDECARQLGRTPASVALRCAWLGIRRPAKALSEAPASKPESKPKQETPEKAPRSSSETKKGAGAGAGAGRVPKDSLEALRAKNGDAAKDGHFGAAERRPAETAPASATKAPKKLSKAGVPWTPEEDEKLLRLHSMGWSCDRCASELPGRTKSACSNRVLALRKENASAGRKPEPEPKPERREGEPKKPLGRMRKCHDCGRPTADYRCPQCWEKIRGHIALEEEGL